MLKMFKIPLYIIILLLFGFTANGASAQSQICGDEPFQYTVQVNVGNLKGNVCQNYDTYQVFRAIKNDTLNENGYEGCVLRNDNSGDCISNNTGCKAPGAVCKLVGSVGCGRSGYPQKSCNCVIHYTRCLKSLEQNRSQNMQKNQFKRQRGTFSGNKRQRGTFSGK